MRTTNPKRNLDLLVVFKLCVKCERMRTFLVWFCPLWVEFSSSGQFRYVEDNEDDDDDAAAAAVVVGDNFV